MRVSFAAALIGRHSWRGLCHQSNDFRFFAKPPTASSTISLYHHHRHQHHPLVAAGPSKGSSLRSFRIFRQSPLYRRNVAHLNRPGDTLRCRSQGRTCHQPAPAVPPGTCHLQPYSCKHRVKVGRVSEPRDRRAIKQLLIILACLLRSRLTSGCH